MLIPLLCMAGAGLAGVGYLVALERTPLHRLPDYPGVFKLLELCPDALTEKVYRTASMTRLERFRLNRALRRSLVQVEPGAWTGGVSRG